MDREPYLQVFQACEPDKDGFISLKNLANISRSHVESGDVDKILQIFDNAEQDRLNFDEFCDYIDNFMKKAKDKENLTPEISPTRDKEAMYTTSPIKSSNMNMKTPYIGEGGNPQIQISNSPTSGENRQIGANITNKRKMTRKNSKTRNSQTRLTGQIPLVNTSSEDEQDLEEDSFDRKIAEELEFAGKQLESAARIPQVRASPPRYLVRGSNSRSTLRSKSSGRLPFAPLVITESPKMKLLSPIVSAETSIDKFDDSMANPPTMNSKLALQSPAVGDKWSRHSSPIIHDPDSPSPVSHSPSDAEEDRYEYDVDSLEYPAKSVPPPARVDPVNMAATKDLVDHLEHKVSSLTSNQLTSAPESVQNFDDLYNKEFDVESEIEKIRRQANENIMFERENHREEIRALNKERELEIANYKLRIEQLQGEVDRLEKDKTDLNEKVRLLYLEKESVDDTVLKLQEDMIRMQDDHKFLEDKMQDTESKDSTRERISEVSKMSLGSDQLSTTESYENEYLLKIQQMVARIQEQDDIIQELKEDNLVLRNQKRFLLDAFNNEKNWKRSFLGGTRNRSLSNANDVTYMGLDTDDPQDIRVQTSSLHSQLAEQTDMNRKLKAYLDEVLMTIMIKNPDILEKSNNNKSFLKSCK